jgi:hypothetical protein
MHKRAHVSSACAADALAVRTTPVVETHERLATYGEADNVVFIDAASTGTSMANHVIPMGKTVVLDKRKCVTSAGTLAVRNLASGSCACGNKTP